MTDAAVTDRPALIELERGVPFAERHIGPRDAELATILAAIGAASLDELADTVVPAAIRDTEPVPSTLPPAGSETEVLAELRTLAARNTVTVPMIGLGYHGTVTPPVIRRHVLENPAWYTAYTPYQPEISQGRLEALLTFQTTVADLTGLPVAGASLLDEATAAAEAMTLLRRANRSTSPRFLVDVDTLPQTRAVLATRAAPLGIDLVPFDPADGLPDGEFYGLLLSYPGASGAVRDLRPVIAAARERGALTAVAADLLALTLLTPPGELGADVAVGTTQRFGVPLGFGGPHAGYLSVRDGLARQLPGRLVGLSRDADGRPALRLALQTREQHIRREKATSNICTAQVLLAVVAACYAVYHGPEGLARIALRAHRMAAVLAAGLRAGGVEVVHEAFFDTVRVRAAGRAGAIADAAHADGIALHRVDADTLGIACSELTTVAHLEALWAAFGVQADAAALDAATVDALPAALARTSAYLMHPVFHEHRSETALMRWLRRLADADMALDRDDDPARLVHHEAQRGGRDGADHLARIRRPAPVRARRRRRGHPRTDRRPRTLAGRAHRLRGGLPAAQRGQPGRARGSAGDRGVPPQPRRRAPQRLPHPGLGPRHQRGVGGDGGAARGRGGHRPYRRRRPRRPARQDRPTRGQRWPP